MHVILLRHEVICGGATHRLDFHMCMAVGALWTTELEE